jgi:hyaluronoglucosaminidase
MTGSHRALLILLACWLVTAAVPAAADRFEVRMVKAGAPPDDPAIYEHLEHSRRLGFNAVWVYANAAGAWTPTAAPEGPRLTPEFLSLARWCRERDLRIFVSVNPTAETAGRIVFSDPEYARRILRFFRKLRRKAGVHDFVLSFDDQPTELTELGDIAAYGRNAAAAHLDLLQRIEAGIPKKNRLWFCAAAYADTHLHEDTDGYSSALLEGLPEIRERVGIVWTGPSPVPPAIRRADLAATRERLGGRPLLLYDNYPANGDWFAECLALVLGPLRGRDPDLASEADAYLSCPMAQLGASRLPLATVADWLDDPDGYDPDASWERAQAELVGSNPEARRALRDQATEWGGWIGTPEYKPVFVESIYTIVDALERDHAASALASVVSLYPERMAALEQLQDEPFRRDLLEMMGRRLAVARAIPLIREYLARESAGRTDLQEILEELSDLRERQASASTRSALSTLYEAGGVVVPESSQPAAPVDRVGSIP